MKTAVPTCFAWALSSPEITRYHDTEWGVPLHDERGLFEQVVLEGAQAGLSWEIVLKKREGYRMAFAGFDPEVVASFTDADVDRLVANPAIIRHRKKIESAIGNARAFLETAEKHGGFAQYVWGFVDGKPIHNSWTEAAQVPAHTPLAHTISKDLKKRDFSFVGPTTVYAFMQATGMVNDHLVSCFRHHEIRAAHS